MASDYRSQAAVAQKLGIERTRYLTWESRGVKPNLDMLKQICEIFDVSADYLLGLVDEPCSYKIKNPAELAGQGVEPVEKGGTDQLTADEVAAVRAMLEQNRH